MDEYANIRTCECAFVTFVASFRRIFYALCCSKCGARAIRRHLCLDRFEIVCARLCVFVCLCVCMSDSSCESMTRSKNKYVDFCAKIFFMSGVRLSGVVEKLL